MWACPRCKTQISPRLAQCWKCGMYRPNDVEMQHPISAELTHKATAIIVYCAGFALLAGFIALLVRGSSLIKAFAVALAIADIVIMVGFWIWSRKRSRDGVSEGLRTREDGPDGGDRT